MYLNIYIYRVEVTVKSLLDGLVEWKECLEWGSGKDVSLKNKWHKFLHLLHLRPWVTWYERAHLTGEIERLKDILNLKARWGIFFEKYFFPPRSILLFSFYSDLYDIREQMKSGLLKALHWGGNSGWLRR